MGRDRLLCSSFICLYHLSSMTNCSMIEVLVAPGSFLFLSLGFWSRKTMDILALLSLIVEVVHRPERGNFCFWSAKS